MSVEISISDLQVAAGSKIILNDLNFTLKQQKITVVIGPSGSGKSTLLHALAGWQELSHGKIEPSLSMEEVGMLFQDYQLFPWHTVSKNFLLAQAGLKLTKTEKHQRAIAIAGQLEVSALFKHYPHQLSGGQQQRVALGQLLLKNARYLLLDEPTSALDAFTKEKIQDVLLQLQSQNQVTIVMVTHSIEEAAYLGHEVLVLHEGQLLAQLTNSHVGSSNYRQSPHFFEQQVKLRQLLGGGGVDHDSQTIN